MDFCSSAARGRQAASLAAGRFLNTAALLLLALIGMAWSNVSLAQSCDFVPIGATGAIGPAGGTVTFSVRAETACNNPVTMSFSIFGADGTNGASIAAPTTVVVPLNVTHTFTVNLGPTPGGTGTARASCIAGCFGQPPVDFTFVTNNDFDYTPIGSTTITTNVISSFTPGTNLILNGSPGTTPTTFTQLPATVYGTVPPDGSGDATITRSIAIAGTYTVQASLACPRLLEGCGLVPPIDFTVNVEPVAVTAIGSTTPTTVAGTPLPLAVRYGSASLPAPNGTPMTWSVTGPAGGDGVVTGNPVAGGAGRSNASFNATVPGVYTVTANSGCTFCAPGFLSFTVTVTPLPTLAINGGNGQTSQVGTAYPTNLSVIARNSGVPAGTVSINWLVTGGSAAITNNGPTDSVTGIATAMVVPVTAGPITITATRADAPGVSVTFNLTGTSLPHTLNSVSPNPASGTDGTPMSFTVRLLQSGTPVNAANIRWTAAAPFSPANLVTATNAAGDATASFTPSAPGNFTNVVRADYDPDGIPATGDEVSFAFNATVASVPTLTISGGNGQSGQVGVDYPALLSVLAQDSGALAVGVNINWVVTGGSAAISSSGATDPTGQSRLSVNPSAPGVITITATRADAPAATVTFSLTATTAPVIPYTLVPVSPNPLTGTLNTPLPVTVRLLQGGTPVNGATVVWNAGPPFAPASTSSTTDAAGNAVASFTPSASGSFPNVITAFVDPDGIAGNGDEVSLNYNANVGFVAGLVATGGNGQNALVGAAYPLPLTVHADNGGANAAGVTINWSLASGSATLSAPTSVTNASGNAVINVVAGATPGPVTIVASRQDAPAATASFTLSVNSLGTMSIIGGDDQLLVVGIPSAPMTVELKNAAGVPIAGAVVTWTTSAGTLSQATGQAKALTETTTTDGAGRTSNTVTATGAGPVQVSAASPLAAAPAVFHHNGALGNLEGLDPAQETVAHAVDEFCPALAAMPSRTPQQQDLLDRCKELVTASSLDPGATALALDQMMADVALTQVNAAFNAAQSQFQNLKTRIAALRSGTGGTSFGGLALNTPTGPVSLGMLGNAFGEEEGTPAEIGADFSRWGFFAAGTIGRGEADEGQRNPAYDYDINGITAGVDYRKNDKWIFGGSVGYTAQDTSLPGGRGGLDTSGWSISAYSTYYQQDSWYADGVVTWGHNSYELVRQITYTLPTAGGGTTTIQQVAEADSGGDLLSTAFTFGRDFNRGALGIGPYGRLLYTRLGFDTIDEDLLPGVPGSGLGLRIENRDVTSLATVLGTKFTYTYSTDWGVLMPHMQVEWEHEFKDDPQSIEARFINDPTGSAMVLRGDPLDTDYFRLGLGMSMVLTRGRSGFFYYERLVGRNGMSQWNLALGIRMEF